MREQFDLFKDVPEERAFGGETYDHQRDFVRLSGQLLRVYNVMLDGRWRTLAQIAALSAPGTEAAVSARLRDLRKDKFGAHDMQAECIEGGLWRYRMVLHRSS